MHGKYRERHKRKTHLSISGERKRHRFQIGGGTFNCLEEGRREEDSFIAGWKSSGEFITHAGVELAIRALAYVPLFSLSQERHNIIFIKTGRSSCFVTRFTCRLLELSSLGKFGLFCGAIIIICVFI